MNIMNPFTKFDLIITMVLMVVCMLWVMIWLLEPALKNVTVMTAYDPRCQSAKDSLDKIMGITP